MTVTYPFTDPAARRSALVLAERLRALPPLRADMVRVANADGFDRWLEQIRGTGGCARPVYLAGYSTTVDPDTGAVLAHYSTADEPGGRLPVRCRNRRSAVCPSCSREHSGDTYHLVRSGLVGGKCTPPAVSGHPALFTTLTAPSFGTVHRTGRCHPRRARTCPHGRTTGCGLTHDDTHPAIGTPLCDACYDYPRHVLWHAMAGRLWNRWCLAVRRRLATSAGITQTDLGHHLRVSYAKVAEYQRRRAIHFHAVVRLDGPDGPDTPPPAWATAELLQDAIEYATRTVEVAAPYSEATGDIVCRFGAQLDVHPITSTDPDAPGPLPDAVAGYIAKYTSKGTSDAGGTDHPVRSYSAIALASRVPHVRVLMATAWRLGGLPDLAGLRLRHWIHTLAYRGHVLTKSRAYSTTYKALRGLRTQYRQEPRTLGVTVSVWRFVGLSLTQGEAEFAAGIYRELQDSRNALRGGP